MSIEGIGLEHFIALSKLEINSSKKLCTCHAVFHYFLSDDRKQYFATIILQRKSLIDLLKEKNWYYH